MPAEATIETFEIIIGHNLRTGCVTESVNTSCEDILGYEDSPILIS